MAGKPPEEAKFFWSGGPVEVAERTWFASQLSGVTAFETDDGVVLVDAGAVMFAPMLAGSIREKTQAPIHTAIFTHGHVDHAYGLSEFLVEGQPTPVVIGHEAMPARFARYEATAAHNRAINARQFGGRTSADTGAEWVSPAIPPNQLYADELVIEVGGVTFELFHARGETDDHTWVYCPDRRVLCPGDLIIWGVPNAGNPQKVQRYPWDWADALRLMAAKEPASMAPGHGGPVVDDPELVHRILVDTADYLDAVVERTLAVLEDGSPPHVDVVHAVELPTPDQPWLQPVYDEGQFIVRNVIRHYGGWFSGRPSELKPAPRPVLAGAVAALAGGALELARVANQHAAAGDLAVACHLADFALEADPADETVQEIVAEIYDQRAEAETSLMAVNLMNSAAAHARAGEPYA
ncbi:MAG: MBL fold metallo-hydrolase [Acidimicrobiia bacterium]|nr:MBL fold metallo-hydrolase [Acidimicrobiia bacterium]